ncbi:hypothetical protein BDZ45DRAFT_679140, partial [Acephala macrosclerotiorum]
MAKKRRTDKTTIFFTILISPLLIFGFIRHLMTSGFDFTTIFIILAGIAFWMNRRALNYGIGPTGGGVC